MNCSDFDTTSSVESMAAEISCLKATLALMLKALPQADAGKVLINLETLITAHNNTSHAEVFTQQLEQMKTAYRK